MNLEATLVNADVAYEVESRHTGAKTMFFRIVPDEVFEDEFTVKAEETTMRGGLAPVTTWPERGYETREKAIAGIEATIKANNYRSARRVK